MAKLACDETWKPNARSEEDHKSKIVILLSLLP